MDFVPPGWRLEHQVRGRLDGDQRDDALLILRMEDPANLIDDPVSGPASFDTNPRMLVAAVATADGGWRRVMADHALVPRPQSPVMADYLGEDAAGAVQIRHNRTWTLGLHSWTSAGGWSRRDVTYTFRLEGECMRLVGYDETDVHRGSGDINQTSVNYLTGRAWTQLGHISEDESRPQRWTRLATRARICIDDIGHGLSFEPGLLETRQ
ncbi:MAG: hypothetical protein WCZ02_08665 [Lysobacterales bacterium]